MDGRLTELTFDLVSSGFLRAPPDALEVLESVGADLELLGPSFEEGRASLAERLEADLVEGSAGDGHVEDGGAGGGVESPEPVSCLSS